MGFFKPETKEECDKEIIRAQKNVTYAQTYLAQMKAQYGFNSSAAANARISLAHAKGKVAELRALRKTLKNESSSIKYNSNSRKYSNSLNNSESSYFDYENIDNNNTRNNEGCLKALGCCFKILFFPYYILWLFTKWCIKKIKS